MKANRVVVLLLLTFFVVGFWSGGAYAQVPVAEPGYDYGEVVSSSPIYRDSTYQVPVQNCRVQDVPIYGDTSYGAPNIPGAIVGGIIGNQIGGGRGREAMTAIGAVIGSNYNRANRSIVGYRQERICNTQYEYKTDTYLDGYNISYQYLGNIYNLRTSREYKVGDFIKLRLNHTVID